MKRRELSGEESKPDSVSNFIFENAQGISQALSNIPTTNDNAMSEHDLAYEDKATPDFLYIKLAGKVFKISLTEST